MNPHQNNYQVTHKVRWTSALGGRSVHAVLNLFCYFSIKAKK